MDIWKIVWFLLNVYICYSRWTYLICLCLLLWKFVCYLICLTWTYLICLWHEHFYLTICLCLLFNMFVIPDIWKFVHERVCLTCSFIVRERVRLLFTNKLVKINRVDLKPISSIITFKRAELEHSLKNLNEHEPLSNNLKNKRTICEQSQTRLDSDRLQP